MQINIRGENLKITTAIKKYAEEKLSKLEKYFDNPKNIDVKVTMKIRGEQQIVEVMVNATKFTIRAEVSHADMYAAIDLVQEKLERQIKKNKNKIKSKLIREFADEFTEFEMEEEEEETKIVKRKRIFLKPMDEEEAILQMELVGHEFFIFKNVDTESICLLYKRKDGQYGMIDTE